MGWFRIITFGGWNAGYVGRRIPASTGNPDERTDRISAQLAQVAATDEQAQLSWPAPPPSRSSEYPWLYGEHYKQAEAHWTRGRPDLALPLYERVLADHETVLCADDIATLQIRQRLADVYLAAGYTVAALALITPTYAHLSRVMGPAHPDTRRAAGSMANSRALLGSADKQAGAIGSEAVQLQLLLGPDNPATLRTECEAASSRLFGISVTAWPNVLARTLERSERVLGPHHPDTAYIRQQLVWLCESAERTGKLPDLRTAVLGRERAHGPEAPETLTALCELARRLASSWWPRRRREALQLLRNLLQRCEQALGPNHPLTIDVRRQLARGQKRQEPVRR